MGSGATGSCFFLFDRRRSSSLFCIYEKLKVIGRLDHRIQPSWSLRWGVGCIRDCSGGGGGEAVYSYTPTKIALSLAIAFFPSSLHWPQCVPPALGTWLCYLHPTRNLRGEEGQPGNTEAGRRPVEDLAWSHKGLSGHWSVGPVEAGEHQEGEQPASVRDKPPAISFPDLPPLETKGHSEVWSHLFSTLQFLYKQPRGTQATSERKYIRQIQREI